MLSENEFDVFYNTRFSGRFTGERDDYEIDFIVADIRGDKLNGMLCIEVKGGNISVEPNGSWLQNNRVIKSPLDQIKGAKNSLVRRYPELAKRSPIGWALCFPDVVIQHNMQLPDSLSRNLIIDSLELNEIQNTIRSHFADLKQRHPAYPGAEIRLYNNVFKAPKVRQYSFVMPLSNRIGEDEKQFIKLTEEQGKTLQMVSENPRIIVKGIAGSGKTLVAKEIAQKHYEQGKRVLFLCFNKVLANNIDSHFTSRDNKDNKINTGGCLNVLTFHSFAYSVISPFDPEWWKHNIGGQNFWDFEVPAKIEEFIADGNSEYHYDAIIIDEGQDFMEFWFEVIDDFLKPDGNSYIFMDDHQNINQALCNIPRRNEYTILSWNENCRNTKRISEKLSDVLKLAIASKEDMPDGKDVVEKSFRSPVELQTDLIREINKLITEEGIKPGQILILLNSAKEDSSLGNTNRISNLPLSEMRDNGVLDDATITFTHINRYKGLEADIVFIVDAQKAAHVPKKLYTQASRAKHLLYIYQYSE